MANARETFRGGDFCLKDRAVPTRLDGLVRQANGLWSGLITLDHRVPLPDGRVVIFKRQVRVRATDQVGRKPRRIA